MDEHTHPDLLEDKRSVPEAPRRKRRLLPRVAGVLAVAGVIGAGFLYWLDARHYESTDDAFIDGNISQVSAQVSGRVTRILADDNAPVRAGQVLVELDSRDAESRVAQAVAQRDQAEAQLEQASAMLPVRQADLDQAGANVRVSQSELQQSKRDFGRYTAINPRAISAQTIDTARASLTASQARLDAASQVEAGAKAQLAVARTQIAAAQAALRLADANLAQARLDLSYTHILAPADGRIAKRTVQLGNYVTPGQALLAVVQPGCWVTANFKESQLADMRPGQPAKIAIDAFGGRTLDAHVVSLQPGTGSVFSSMPAENATGNYVKIVQRLPVKLAFDGDECGKMGLAPGMSVEPRVKLR